MHDKSIIPLTTKKERQEEDRRNRQKGAARKKKKEDIAKPTDFSYLKSDFESEKPKKSTLGPNTNLSLEQLTETELEAIFEIHLSCAPYDESDGLFMFDPNGDEYNPNLISIGYKEIIKELSMPYAEIELIRNSKYDGDGLIIALKKIEIDGKKDRYVNVSWSTLPGYFVSLSEKQVKATEFVQKIRGLYDTLDDTL